MLCERQPITPRVHFQTIVEAQQLRLTARELRTTVEHKREENRLLLAMLKRRFSEVGLLATLNANRSSAIQQAIHCPPPGAGIVP